MIERKLVHEFSTGGKVYQENREGAIFIHVDFDGAMNKTMVKEAKDWFEEYKKEKRKEGHEMVFSFFPMEHAQLYRLAKLFNMEHCFDYSTEDNLFYVWGVETGD